MSKKKDKFGKGKKKEKKKKEKRDTQKEGYSWKAFFPFTEEGKAMRTGNKAAKKAKGKSGKDKKKRRGMSFEQHLKNAGLDVDEEVAKKWIFRTALTIMFLLSLFLLFKAIQAKRGALGVFEFMLGFWTVVFLAVLMLTGFFFSLYLDLRAYRRTKDLEAVLPDFLQLASANISAGMPVDRALWFAVRPNFGILAKEVEEVAKATYAGRDLSEALTDFANKFDSQNLKRAVSLILEGMAAGGEMAELLNKIALNIEEINIQKKEMAANVTTYVIFIGMATVVGAPFLFGLATQLLNVIHHIAGNIGGSSSATGGSLFSLSINPNSIKLSDFKLYASLMLAVSSFFSGAIISVIRKGNIKEGAVLIPFFMVTTFLLYQLANLLLGVLMSGFF